MAPFTRERYLNLLACAFLFALFVRAYSLWEKIFLEGTGESCLKVGDKSVATRSFEDWDSKISKILCK